MASYHFDLKTFSRARGQSAVAAASYRSGELLHCERDGLDKIPARNPADVLHKKLVGWSGSREQLWNAAEAAEKRKNSTVARELIVALPYELSQSERNELAESIAQHIATELGVAVDLCVHRPPREEKNHHAHLLFPTRKIENGELTSKTRILDHHIDGPDTVRSWRKTWENLVNKALEKRPDVSPVSRKSMAYRGLSADAKHGPAIAAIFRREKAEESANIEQINAEIDQARRELLAAIKNEQNERRKRARERFARMAGNLSRARECRNAAAEHRNEGVELRIEDGIFRTQRSEARDSDLERINTFVDHSARQSHRARRLALVAVGRAKQAAEHARGAPENAQRFANNNRILAVRGVNIANIAEPIDHLFGGNSEWRRRTHDERAGLDRGAAALRATNEGINGFIDRLIEFWLKLQTTFQKAYDEWIRGICETQDVSSPPELPEWSNSDLRGVLVQLKLFPKYKAPDEKGRSAGGSHITLTGPPMPPPEAEPPRLSDQFMHNDMCDVFWSLKQIASSAAGKTLRDKITAEFKERATAIIAENYDLIGKILAAQAAQNQLEYREYKKIYDARKQEREAGKLPDHPVGGDGSPGAAGVGISKKEPEPKKEDPGNMHVL